MSGIQWIFYTDIRPIWTFHNVILNRDTVLLLNYGFGNLMSSKAMVLYRCSLCFVKNKQARFIAEKKWCSSTLGIMNINSVSQQAHETPSILSSQLQICFFKTSLGLSTRPFEVRTVDEFSSLSHWHSNRRRNIRTGTRAGKRCHHFIYKM